MVKTIATRLMTGPAALLLLATASPEEDRVARAIDGATLFDCHRAL